MALYEDGATYGTRNIGSLDNTGKTKCTGKTREERTENVGRFTFTFIVTDTPGNTFAATCDAIEEDFRTYRQAFVYQYGSTNNPWVNWDPTTAVNKNTGFNARPSIRKIGEDADTRGSRKYEVTIEVDLPAKLSATYGGRRSDSRIEIDYDESRLRTLTLSGTYTAQGNTSAYAQYQNTIAAYAATVYGALGGTWELQLPTRGSYDETNKLFSFTRIYRELAYNQSTGSLDDPSLIGARMILSRKRTKPFTYPYVKGQIVSALMPMTVVYSARLDLEQVYGTSGNPAHIIAQSSPSIVDDVYTSKIRPWILQNIKALAGNQFAIVDERPDLDPVTGSINVAIDILAVDGSSVFEATMSVTDVDQFGWALPGHWTGRPLAKSAHQGIAHRTRTIAFTARGLAKTDGTPAVNLEPAVIPPVPPPPKGSGGTGFYSLNPIQLSRTRILDGPERIGPPDDSALYLIKQTTIDVIEFYQDVGATQDADAIKQQLADFGGLGGSNPPQSLTP